MQLKVVTLCTCVEAFLYIVYFAQVSILRYFPLCRYILGAVETFLNAIPAAGLFKREFFIL